MREKQSDGTLLTLQLDIPVYNRISYFQVDRYLKGDREQQIQIVYAAKEINLSRNSQNPDLQGVARPMDLHEPAREKARVPIR